MITLTKKPKSPTVLIAFPGPGFVGTITIEFLIEHLHTECIGRISLKDEVPIVAIHEGKLVESMAIFYSEEYNIILVRSVTKVSKNFREISDDLISMRKELKAGDTIILDGVSSPAGTSEIFYFCKEKDEEKKYAAMGLKPLKEGIVIGATAELLSNLSNVSCIFAETTSDLPDSKTAAEMIKVLDKRFNLKVDYTPLIETAKKFENNLRQVAEKSRAIQDEQEKKKLNYVG